MNNTNIRHCPVCGASGGRIVHRQRFLDGPLCDGYDVLVCTNCGMGFADGIPPQSKMDRYYSEQSKYSYDHMDGAESVWDIKRFEATAEQLIPHLNTQKARILDIGCATGGLLSVFKKRGYGNVFGVDPSPGCAASASRLHGINVRIATLSELYRWDEKFDLIMMLGVLEHLNSVKEAVNAAARLLSLGGRLYCAVPDVQGLATCPNAPYQQFSIEHVNFFSATSLRRLLAECGMDETGAWSWNIEWRQGVWEPIVSGLYELRQPFVPPYDTTTETALQKYLEYSENEDKGLLRTVESLVESREPVIVWGAGTLARRLLANTRFNKVNFVAFVDSSPHLQSRSLAGLPVLRPSQIYERTELILICSISFEAEIAIAIRGQHKIMNRLLSLRGNFLS